MDELKITIFADDRITGEGAAAYLRSQQGFALLPAELMAPSDVIVVLAAEVTEVTLRWMQQAAQKSTNPDMRIILVADGIGEVQLLRAVNYGLVSVLLRPKSSLAHVVDAVLNTRRGRADVPQTLARTLIEQLRTMSLTRPVPGMAAGLSARDIDVLKLLAEGLDTVQIAEKLSYSERTVKNIIHGIMTRLGLRNRAHAVAYALRSGVLRAVASQPAEPLCPRTRSPDSPRRTTPARRNPGGQAHRVSPSPSRSERTTMTPDSEPDIQPLLRQAQQVRHDLAQAQQELIGSTVHGVAGGGLVKATLSGTGQLQDLEISPIAADPDNTAALADLIIDAVEDARSSIAAMHERRLRPLVKALGDGLRGRSF